MKHVRQSLIRGRLAASVLVLATAAVVQAGGFKIQDQSTRAMGMADAFVAGADDASAIYYNPAGLTELTGPEVIGNLYVAHAVIEASGPGIDETSDGRVYVIPNFYTASPWFDSENVFVGLGVYSPYGLGSRWGDDTVNARFVSLGEIRFVNVNPTVAWRLGDTLSLGAGLDVAYSRAISRQIIDNPPFFTGAELDIDGEGVGWGYNLGLRWKCREDVTVGLTYRSQIDVHYEGDLDFDAPPGMGFQASADTEIRYPETVSLGIQWKATSKLRMEFTAQWDEWSVLEQQILTHTGPLPPAGMPNPTVSPKKWEDSWVLMLGGEYDLSKVWTLRAGYGYNQTPVPDDTADPSLPTGDTHAVSVGAGYRLSEHSQLDMALLVAYGTEKTLNNPVAPPDTEYESVSGYMSVGWRYRF